MNRTLRRYLITLAIGLAMASIIWVRDGLFSTRNTQQILKSVSNGSFLAGTLLVGVGLMVFISNSGFFDAFRYTALSIFRSFTAKGEANKEEMADYKARRRERKGQMAHLIIVGLVFMAVALVAALLFERNYQPPF